MEVGAAICEGYELGEGVWTPGAFDKGGVADLLGYWGGRGQGESAGGRR